jgi:signal transduction histidine kinase
MRPALARARRLESERAAAALAERLRSSLSTTLRSIGDPVIATDASGSITLLSNAVKFTHNGGRVTVQLCQVGSSIGITVADNGKGIAPSFLPHVFEALRQEDASISRASGGLGLGLSITRELVELHGGRITAQSGGEGRGATFTVSLPVSAVDTSAQRQGTAHTSTASFERPESLRGLRALVVDDEEDARQFRSSREADRTCRAGVARRHARPLSAA